MAKQVAWTKVIVDEFIEIGMLSEDEQMILRTRAAGWTRTKQAEELGMSLATVDRLIKRLKIKYDNVQQHSVLLPPRRDSVEETYMDTH